MTMHTLLSIFGTLVVRLIVALLACFGFHCGFNKTMLAMTAPTKYTAKTTPLTTTTVACIGTLS